MTANQNIELDWLKRWAEISPNAPAIRCADSGRSFSYAEFFERSCALAGALARRLALRAGDRVAFFAQNEPEALFLFFALQRLGCLLVPVNFRFTAREADHVLRDSGAKALIYHEDFTAVVEKLEAKPELMPFRELEAMAFDSAPAAPAFAGAFDSPVMILYTSGTTGAPKGALITNKMLFWNSVNTGLRLNITQGDRTVIFHPLFHTSGWNVLTTPFLHHGASIVMLKKFDPARVLELCEKEKLTVLFGVPTMMDMMARAGNFREVDLSSVRYGIVGGEPMPVELIRIWAEKGIPIRQGFGLTEFGPNCFSLGEADAVRKMGSIGTPNFYTHVKIVNAEGLAVSEPDTVGELCLSGPMCTPGYWQNEKATKEAIRDGWFHTGDLVKRDSEGYFYVVGRKKEMFISGAENVYPAEIEKFLRTHPALREVAVVGVKDEKWGEVGKCFYSTEKGEALTEEELRAFCLQGLAKYKIPKTFTFLSELPKGPSGKIQRRDLPLETRT
jgi:fatty-acyl-CoA synthase